MLKTILVALLPLLMLFGDGSDLSLLRLKKSASQAGTGTLEKMIAANGSVSMNLDLGRLGTGKKSRTAELRFQVENNSFFKVLVFNGEFRGSEPSAMGLVPQNTAPLPARLNASREQLTIESLEWGGQYDLAIRDAKTGYVFFYVEGNSYDYDGAQHVLAIPSARLVLSREFASDLGRAGDTGSVVGNISMTANMRTIEVTEYVEGEATAETLPAGSGADAAQAFVPGPDVVVGDLSGLAQFGTNGTQVGLAVGTDSCNFGNVDLDWFANPVNDHPVIPQNLYRMSGGATNDQTFEQIGQSSMKHAFTALTNNICNLGCNGVGGSHLGSGCSDPYGASLNAGPSLGSRAWVNPFTGFYPRNDSATPNNLHTGHGDTSSTVNHRILVNISDLATNQNPGATYYAEGQYITPHEYVWCQANPGQCNMFNNVSYRRYNVTGTGSPFSFSPAAATVRTVPAIKAWPGATFVDIRPDPANDGMGILAYKVTNPSPGVWHYEYAIYNMNLDRGISSFSVPIGDGVSVTNVGFHAPPQHPGWAFDGTMNNAGYSSASWVQSESSGFMSWSSENFAANQNANAIRWGTMYNIRFDSTSPPFLTIGTVGFFKTGTSMNIRVVAPANTVPTCSRVPTGNRCTAVQ